MAGKDASKQFWKYHNEGILKKFQKQLQIGSLDSKPKPEPKVTEKKMAATPVAESGTVSAAPAEPQEEDEAVPLDMFGDLIPFADPNWYQSVGIINHLRPSQLY